MRTLLVLALMFITGTSTFGFENPFVLEGTDSADVVTGYLHPTLISEDTYEFHTGIDIDISSDVKIKTVFDSYVYHVSYSQHGGENYLALDGQYGWHSHATAFHHTLKSGSWAQGTFKPLGQNFAKTGSGHVHVEYLDAISNFFDDAELWSAACRHPGDNLSLCFGDNDRPVEILEDYTHQFSFESGKLYVIVPIWDVSSGGSHVFPSHVDFSAKLKRKDHPDDDPVEIDLTMNTEDCSPIDFRNPQSPNYSWLYNSDLANFPVTVLVYDGVSGFDLADLEWSYHRLHVEDYCGNASGFTSPERAEELTPDMNPLGVSVFPNPGNPKICFEISDIPPGPLDVSVYDVRGRLQWHHRTNVTNQTNETLWWDGRNNHGVPVASGVYFVNVQSRNQSVSEKVVLLK